MKLKHLISALALTLPMAGSAQAAVISGWDFSQWVSGGGLLSIDGATGTNVLGANYSNLDSSFNAGPDSGVYGAMYMNGSFGSTNITPVFDGSEAFLPVAGSLSSNINGIVPNPFDSLSIQIAEGAIEANLNSMQSSVMSGSTYNPASIVFSADPGAGSLGDTWSISFGARTALNPSTITVEFSTDGTVYASVGSASLSAADTLYTFAAAAGSSAEGFFRLTFNAPSQILDNVAISANVTVPEPMMASLLALGLAGLGYLGRRRAA